MAKRIGQFLAAELRSCLLRPDRCFQQPGFGYLALMMRKGGTVHALAPWQPDVHFLYSPGAFIWWAFLSDLLGLPMHQVMLPFTHIMAGFAALVCMDLGQALLPNMPRARW